MTDETATAAITAATDLAKEVREHTEVMETLVSEFRAQQRWTKRRIRGIAAALVILLALACLSGYTLYRVQHDTACVSTWANESADRTSALYQPTLDRDNALSKLIQLIPTNGTRADPSMSLQALITFDKLDDDLATARANNPPPVPPELHC